MGRVIFRKQHPEKRVVGVLFKGVAHELGGAFAAGRGDVREYTGEIAVGVREVDVAGGTVERWEEGLGDGVPPRLARAHGDAAALAGDEDVGGFGGERGLDARGPLAVGVVGGVAPGSVEAARGGVWDFRGGEGAVVFDDHAVGFWEGFVAFADEDAGGGGIPGSGEGKVEGWVVRDIKRVIKETTSKEVVITLMI